ncbi:MAG: hypothetical protein ACRDOU_05275 [Streptosporangiaceae bacterium]
MRPQRRRTITGEIVGRWVIAFALVPIGLLVLLPAHGHVTGGLLIWLIGIMVVVAIVRASRHH